MSLSVLKKKYNTQDYLNITDKAVRIGIYFINRRDMYPFAIWAVLM